MQQIADCSNSSAWSDHVQLTENDIDFAILVDLTDQDLERSALLLWVTAATLAGDIPNVVRRAHPQLLLRQHQLTRREQRTLPNAAKSP